MRRRVAHAAVILLATVAWTWGSTDVATSVVPSGPPRGNVEPALDPVPAGKVAVVAPSAPVDGSVAVIVQNGTATPVRNVRVTGFTTTPDGSSATKSSTQSVLPSTLAPDEIALGVVQFRPSAIAADSTLSFRVASRHALSAKDPTALDVGSLVLSPPLTGDVAQLLGVTVTNPSSRDSQGSVRRAGDVLR